MVVVIFSSLFQNDLISTIALRKITVFSRGKQSYESTLIDKKLNM